MTTRPTAALLATVLLATGCRTTTTTARTEPAIEGTRVTATRYEPMPTTVKVEVRHPTQVVFTVARPERCFETTTTTMKVTATDTTAVAETDRKNATPAQLAGAAVVGLGVVGGAVTSLVTVYDARQRSGDAFVPVAEQAGFALWPIGVGVAAVSVLAGAPAIAAPWIVGIQESVVTRDERSETAAEAESAACARETPAEGAVALGLDDKTQDLGMLSDGRFTMDAPTLLDAALIDHDDPENAARLTLGGEQVAFLARGDQVLIQRVVDDGVTDEVVARIPAAAFPKLSAVLAQRAARAEAERVAAEQRRAAEAEAARKKAEADERVRLAKLKRDHATMFKGIVVPEADEYPRTVPKGEVSEQDGECGDIGGCRQVTYTLRWVSSSGRFGLTTSQIDHVVAVDDVGQSWTFAFRAAVEDRSLFFHDEYVDGVMKPYEMTSLYAPIRQGLLRATQRQAFEEEVAVGKLSCLLRSQGGSAVMYTAQCRPKGW